MMAGNARQPLFHFGLGLAGSDQSVERHYANHLILYKDLTIVFINSWKTGKDLWIRLNTVINEPTSTNYSFIHMSANILDMSSNYF